MRNLIKNFELLEKRIEEIIGTPNDSPICVEINTNWCLSDDGKYINFDRCDTGDMSEYNQFEISSLGTLQEELFMGVEDGLYFIMAHEEDSNWDDTCLFIFDVKYKVEWVETDW